MTRRWDSRWDQEGFLYWQTQLEYGTHEDVRGSLCVGASCWVFANLGYELCANDAWV